MKTYMRLSMTVFLAILLIPAQGCGKKSTSTKMPAAFDFDEKTKSVWMEVSPHFKTAFDYIETTDLRTLTAGTYEIDGTDVYLIIVEGELKTADNTQLEVHDRYYDIHVPLSSSERFGYRKRNECAQPIGSIDVEKDILFFDDAFAGIILVNPMQFIVFAPDDAHAPMIGEGTLKKAIVKVIL